MAFLFGLCKCTVHYYELSIKHLRVATYSFFEKLDIVKTIKGLLWQADLKKLRHNLLRRKILPHSLLPPELWGYFFNIYC
jgi:hypothetical protein